MNQGGRRSPARLLAPLALLVAAAAVLLVIQASGSDGDTNGERAKTQQEQQTTPTTERKVRQRARYTVKLNDTLSLISEKTGVSVERLQELNPELDPQNLIVGQKIKLRE